MDIRPVTTDTSDRVEHWLATTMEDVELMKHERSGEKAPSTSSSSPARPKSVRNYLLSAATSSAKVSSKPRSSQRGGRAEGGRRGRGKIKSTFDTLLPSTHGVMPTPITARPLERPVTPSSRTAAMAPHLNMKPPALPQPSTSPGKDTTLGSPDRKLTPTGPAMFSRSPRKQGNLHSSRMSQSYRPGRSRAAQNSLELAVNVTGLPRFYTTWMVYQLFEQYGNINFIRVERSTGKARVVLRPAPEDVSWIGPAITAAYLDSDGNKRSFRWQAVDDTKPTSMYRSPKSNNVYPEQIGVSLASIDFGTMTTENAMTILYSIDGPSDSNASLTLDLVKKRVLLNFEISMPATNLCAAITRTFKIQLDIAHINEMVLVQGTDGYVSVIFTVNHPPEVYRKTCDIRETHEDPDDGDQGVKNAEWREFNAWYRQTDIDTDPVGRDSPVHLRKTNCILDTGRWLSYRMKFGPSAASSQAFTQFCQALADHNVRADVQKSIEYKKSNLDSSWAWLDTLQKSEKCPKPNSSLSDLLEMTDTVHLTFPVHYQLEVCLSLGVLHECNIHVGFLTRLAALDPHRAVRILEKVADRKERVYDPDDIFRLRNQVSVVEKQRPGYCAKIPSAVVTPTNVYFSTPVLETSNRVVRNFAQHEGRFLRVKFNDEKHKGGLHSQDQRIMDEVFSRVFRTMTHGIMVGGRRYEFLAFGSSQFRDHGAYFFASTDTLSAAAIRAWMGDFTQFTNVAKYISRLGLCFTTTRGIPHQVTIQRIEDVERNGHQFTDGVGKISPLLADMIASHYKFDYRPSVFQFRMAGCKGVLAVDPNVKGMSVQIRPSQEKFPAPYYGLEIAKTSKFTSANLNVQLILVLSALGIPDGVFMDKLMIMLADMEKAMTDEGLARRLLEKNIDYSQMTLSLSQAIGDGFMETQEPFIISWLHLWRSWSLKYLQQKQRILVEQGAYVFGVTDETSTLRGHFDDGGKAFDEERKAKATEGLPPTKERFDLSGVESQDIADEQADDGKYDRSNDKKSGKSPPLPEIFIQVPNPDAKGGYTVIEAICILTRSPTLHPGDVRVVRAINVPALHHLKDCVVLPQTGDRDLANMCSGGDLDGDEYIVSWDPALIPHESVWNPPAMDFSTAKPPSREGPVTVNDMASFFVNHIKNDKLGQIAVAHKCWADWEPDGVRNEKCVELAELHSQAVDYPKTGMPAKFPRKLHLKQRPHWSEPKGRSYNSKKVIGQLYDAVKLDSFKPAWELPFDQRILNACEPSQQNLDGAKEIKDLYDEAMRRVMAQYGIKNEFEVFTTFVQDHNPDLGDYKFAETIDEVSSNLRSQFIQQCYEKAGTTATERDWDKMKPFIVAMYTVTAQEVGDVVAESQKIIERGGRKEPRFILNFDNVPFMSFPWIFGRDLANIAKGRSGNSSLGYQTAKARPTLPTDKKLAKAQNMVDLFGELEPLAEVQMPEGGVLHVGDIMNLHHNKDRTGSDGKGIKTDDDPLNSTMSAVPGEDVALAFNLLSSMQKGHLQKSAQQMCEENQEEVSFAVPVSNTAIPPANASTEMLELVENAGEISENMSCYSTDDKAPPPSAGEVADTKVQIAAVDIDQPAAIDLTDVSGEDSGEDEEVEIVFDETPSSMLE